MVEPGYPFEGGQLQGLDGFPRGTAVDQFSLVEAIDGFGQGVVVTITLAADGRFDAGLGQSLGVADGNLLRAAILMMDQAGITLGLVGIKRLFQGIQNEVCTH